jgi:hypothetical protein
VVQTANRTLSFIYILSKFIRTTVLYNCLLNLSDERNCYRVMAPNEMLSHESDVAQTTSDKQNDVPSLPYTPRIKWPDLFVQIFLHSGAFYGLLLVLSGSADFRTSLFGKKIYTIW